MRSTTYGVKGLIEEGEAFRTASEAVTPANPAPVRRSARVFHTAMAVAFLLTAFAGFAPTYFLRGLSTRPPLSPLLHVHGMAFTSWLVLPPFP